MSSWNPRVAGAWNAVTRLSRCAKSASWVFLISLFPMLSMVEDRILEAGLHGSGTPTLPSNFLSPQHNKATNYSPSKSGNQWQYTSGQPVLQICFLSTDMMYSTKPSTPKVESVPKA